MNSMTVHIDFNILKKAFREYVRKKAITAGSSIIYMEKGEIIKENPETSQKVKFNTSHFSTHS